MDSRKNARTRTLWLAGVALTLVALACNGAGTPAVPQDASADTAPTQVEPAPTQAPADEPTGLTPTPVPDVAGSGGCTLNAAYVADVTVPDGTEIPPGKAFTKTWRLRNTGTCPWKAGTRLVHVSGDGMNGPAAVPVGPVAPNAGSRISVDLKAPSSPGTYRANWQLESPEGTRFGSEVYVEIVVPAAAAPAPTATPGSQTTLPTAAAPAETDLVIQLDAANSGSSNAAQAQAGDDPGDSRVVGYLSWDLSSIPGGAQIVSARIVWGTQCFRGGDVGNCSGSRNPFPALGNDRLGYLELQHYHYGDLNNPPSVMLNPSLVTPFQVYSSQPTGSLDVTDQVADDLAGGNPFQLRIAFENTTYDGGIGNGIVFVEGSGPNRLEVTYVP